MESMKLNENNELVIETKKEEDQKQKKTKKSKSWMGMLMTGLG